MKKILLTSLATLAITFSVIAQKSFEGTVNFGITYTDMPDEMKQYESMMPKEMTLKIKGDKSRMEQNSAMGSTTTITDDKAKKVTILMNMMGQKIAMEQSTSEDKEDESLKINYLDGTKKIAGYTCKKAEITHPEMEEAMIVYYTEEISGTKTNAQFKGLKGFLMEYTIENQGMIMTIAAKEVKEEKISNAEFTIPSDYESMTEEEFKKQMGGGQ